MTLVDHLISLLSAVLARVSSRWPDMSLGATLGSCRTTDWRGELQLLTPPEADATA